MEFEGSVTRGRAGLGSSTRPHHDEANRKERRVLVPDWRNS